MKLIETIEEFDELIDDVYYSIKSVYINGKKIHKRKEYDGFDDMFDNGYTLNYYLENQNLYLVLNEKTL